MQIFIPKESLKSETRVLLLPGEAKRLGALGADVAIEAGLASSLGIPDQAYIDAGVTIAEDPKRAAKSADMVLRLNPPEESDLKHLKKDAIHVSYVDPFNNDQLIQAMAKANIHAIAMEMIPRSTIAQKMDALSSQANLGGYAAVLLAAEHSNRIFPMMMTPAGTLSPARVFIVGVGVAGLQAIATAKRLGARVEAFDTRPVVEEQVKSLGAKFVKIDIGQTGQTEDGYAKALTEEQLQKQRDGMAKICAHSDILITTAQVFGRKAPVIITDEMVKGMKPGSVIVDCAAETGGNVACTKLGEIIDVNGVTVIGLGNLPGRVPEAASQMYSNNLYNFIEHFWNKESKTFELKKDDEIIRSALLTSEGKIVNERFKELTAT